MAKEYLVLDTETTIKGTCYEIACLVVRYNKNFTFEVLHQMNVIIEENSNIELFHNLDSISYFSNKNLKKRHNYYNDLIAKGELIVKPAASVQVWLDKVLKKYPDITACAYNLPFDIGVLSKNGITIASFKTLDIWSLSSVFFTRKGYYKHALKNKLFTPKLNLMTSCESVMSYLCMQGIHSHYALSDCYDEAAILGQILRQKKSIKSINNSYNWKKFQLPIIVERLGVAL